MDQLLEEKQEHPDEENQAKELRQLLVARQRYLDKQNQMRELDLFSKSIIKLKRDMETLGIKPNKEKLYGRPFRT